LNWLRIWADRGPYDHRTYLQIQLRQEFLDQKSNYQHFKKRH